MCVCVKYIWFDLFGIYGILTIVGYLIPDLFLYIQTVLFQTMQYSISMQFNVQEFYFKQYSLAYKNISILNNSL